MSKPYVEQE